MSRRPSKLRTTAPPKSKTELEYIKLWHEDIRLRINDGKKSQLEIVKWVTAIQMALVFFYFSKLERQLPAIYVFFPVIVGAIGSLLFVSVQDDMNAQRKLLRTLRNSMGGFVKELAERRDDPLHAQAQRDFETTQLAIVVVTSLLAASLLYFSPITNLP
jgi:hypothetical protein